MWSYRNSISTGRIATLALMSDPQWDGRDCSSPINDERDFGVRPLTLSSDAFRALAHQLSNFAADYLQALPQLPSYPQEISGRKTEELFGGDVPWKGTGVDCLRSLAQSL